MVSFAVFLVIAVFSLGSLLVLFYKYNIKNFISLAGTLVMLTGSVLVLLLSESPDNAIPGVIFGVGAFAYIFGIYRYSVSAGQKNSDHNIEIQARTVSDILQVAATRESLIELLNYSLDRFLELFSLNSGAIHIYHKTRDKLIMGAYRGLTPSRAKKLEQIMPGETAIGRAVLNKRVLIIRDLRVSPDYQFFGSKAEGYSFLAVAPIIVDDDCWGVITFLGRKKYHRGMLDISRLEQFGFKLGQALELGRKNRRMTAAFNRLSNKINYYNQLFDSIQKNWLDSDGSIFKTLSGYPSSLFGNRTFGLLMVSSNKCRCVYCHNLKDYSDYNSTFVDNEIDAQSVMSYFKDSRYFKIDHDEISDIVPTGFFENRKLVSYGYSFNGSTYGILIIDESKIADLQNYDSDLQFINHLFKLESIKTAYNINKSKNSLTESFDKELIGLSGELSTILTGMAENVQMLIDRLSLNDDSVNSDDFSRWLENLEKSIFEGLELVKNVNLKNNPNTIIQSVLEQENLDVPFYPGTRLPDISVDHAEFENIVRDILNEAVYKNNKIRIKTSSDNHSLTLTIEGEVKPSFPAEELIKKAGLQNIKINVPDRLKKSQSFQDESETAEIAEPKPYVLIIESKDVIARLLSDLLTRLGYKSNAVISGEKGLDFLKSAGSNKQPVDIVIIDMSLDDISGLELSKKIKELNDSIYTIVVSSWGVNLFQNTLDDAGVDAVLHKPFRLEQLTRVLPNIAKNAAGNQ